MSKFYGSPRWSGEIADCSMPMTFDTYSNCSFGCLYCFSQFQRGIGGAKDAYFNKEVYPVDVRKIKKMFLEPETSQFGHYIQQKKVMQWGGLSDEFDGFERKYGVTLELLKFFKEINYPLSFSTKSVWWTKDERYMELIRGQKNWNFKISIITLDEQKAKIIERGVPSPKERLEAIQRISDADCGGATLRLRPFIIGISSPTYIDLIRNAAKNGATALSTEFFCMEQRSPSLKMYRQTFNELCGFDLFAFYKKYSCGVGYLRLNKNIKKPFFDRMKAACDEYKMRFYVSDAHWKDMCHNGSCCGLPESWNYSRGQFGEALQIAKKNGIVRYSDIRDDIDTLFSDFDIGRAVGFNMNSSEKRAHFYGLSTADYMRWLWNNPQAGQNLYKMFEGIVQPCGKDENGDIIYKYVGECK